MLICKFNLCFDNYFKVLEWISDMLHNVTVRRALPKRVVASPWWSVSPCGMDDFLTDLPMAFDKSSFVFRPKVEEPLNGIALIWVADGLSTALPCSERRPPL